MPIQHNTDAATPDPPLFGTVPLEAPRRVNTPVSLPKTPSPAELEFLESVKRYSRTDWAREQRAEPICDDAIRYLLLGCLSVLPDDFLLHLAPRKRPPLSEVRALAAKSRPCRDDDGILLLVRELTPPAPACPDKPGGRAAHLLHNEATRIYVLLLMRPWMMHACHANASCHLGAACTLSILERFYSWIGIDICRRWWLRCCLQCQVIKASRQTARCTILSLPLPSDFGVAVSVAYFGPLPIIRQESSYLLLLTNRFSRRADMYAVSAAEFTAEGTADILLNKYTPLWGCPANLLSSPIMGYNSSPICPLPCTSFSACQTSRRAPTTPTQRWRRAR